MRRRIANDDGRLGDMAEFGSNPGALIARTYLPAKLAKGAPLVVVLHGCTQSASVYDTGSGWSKLADRHGFALLFPEQRRANNPNLCFNWYLPADARRGQGEAKSISQMIKHMTAEHALDPSRVFVTGLSAGGAMASVMLATYPELFAGGAIIAGLAFARANSLPEALERMRGHGGPSRGELAARARAASPYRGRLPTLSVWHGTRDAIVDPANAGEIVDQWRELHGIGAGPGAIEMADGHRREVWRDADGRDVIERYDINGMGHGTPLDTRGPEACGVAGPHMLEAGICSTRRIAASWGLIDRKAARAPLRTPDLETPLDAPARSMDVAAYGSNDVRAVIDNALRAAGLMR
jgi:poly(hydroxyalkanoate) depolymerase family esterase